MGKSERERLDLYTSTGSKFWSHPEAMRAYKSGRPESVISTHISPTSACNLKCSYCSVRDRGYSTIPIEVIQDYVLKLKRLGLKAVVLTGGGEPTVYPEFSRLVHWLSQEQGLRLGLITNGTLFDRVSGLNYFDWIRISVNDDPIFWSKFEIPRSRGSHFDSDPHAVDPKCVLGLSVVVTTQSCTVEYFQRILAWFQSSAVKYIRVLADCSESNEVIRRVDKKIAACLEQVPSPLFLHQIKQKQAPASSVCHQSYFRPYLSEVPFGDRGPGTVYPCDSVVLGELSHKFPLKHQLCYAADVLEYLERGVLAKFDPRVDCAGCVFTQNVNMLENYLSGWIEPAFVEEKTEHDEFI